MSREKKRAAATVREAVTRVEFIMRLSRVKVKVKG